MVNLLIGPKGSGKTQQMFDLANKSLETCEGNVIFIKNSHHETKNLSHKIRVICMSDFSCITNVDEYIGFLYGMVSADNDIETIYIDGLLKLEKVGKEHLPEFIERVKKISEANNIDFNVSCSVDKEMLKDIKDCNILN